MTLEEMRKDINNINEEMLKLFIKRMELSKEIAKEKIKLNKPIYDNQREAEILEHIRKNTPKELNQYSVQFFKEIMDLSKAYQKDVIEKYIKDFKFE